MVSGGGFFRSTSVKAQNVPRGTFPLRSSPRTSLGFGSSTIVPRGTLHVWESWRVTAATVAIEAE